MAPVFLLTVDLGNTSCKLRVWAIEPGRPPGLVAGVDRGLHEVHGLELERLLAPHLTPRAAVMASVAGREVESLLEAELRARFGEHWWGTPDAGLAIECLEPALVGSDRLFAARGALELARRSCLVLDAGTALTVDALRVGSSAERPPARFLGGAIAPGPALLAAALARGTARLAQVEPRAQARALGRDTREALQAGILHGFRGAAHELCLRVAAEAGLGLERIVLTGGARGFLLDPPLFPPGSLELAPDLVHIGLVAAVRARALRLSPERSAGSR